MAQEKKQVKKVDTSIPMKERYPLTIEQDLYDSWQLHRRYGDPGRICKAKGISRPIVDRALNFGHVKDPLVAKRIYAFFMERVNSEKNSGNRLIAGAKK